MKPFVISLILIILVIGLLAAYKAYSYREALKAYQGYNKKLSDSYQNLQADYAGISIYAAENEKLRNEYSIAERKNMTVLFGASITRGFDLEKYFPERKLINRGIGSQSDTQLLARFSADVLELNPGSVVIKFCSGNFKPALDKETIWNELETMATIADKRGIRPLLATVIPATKRAEIYNGYDVAQQVRNFNSKIRKFAAENHFTVVDYYAAMVDPDGFLPDSLSRDEIHPNEAGYKVMESVLSPVLDRLQSQ